MYQLVYTRRRSEREESNFLIEIFEKNQPGKKGELGELFKTCIFGRPTPKVHFRYMLSAP
jgi:hypothetical protein